jgi:hypothetical protein
MSSEYPILTRQQLGMGERVVNYNHITSRPLLAEKRGLVVVHHPGSKQRFANADLGAVIRGIERWKPGLYNYFIHPNGTIGTQAGRYLGAATKGHNQESYAVNILVGEGEEISTHQVWSFRYLMGVMAWSGAINLTPFIAQHGWLVPTACPGPSVKGRWDELTEGLRWG